MVTDILYIDFNVQYAQWCLGSENVCPCAVTTTLVSTEMKLLSREKILKN